MTRSSRPETFEPTSPTERSLGIEIGMFQSDELFKELGVERDEVGTCGGEGPLSPGFPLLSRLSDPTSDAVYEPDEVDPFLTELLRAQQIVKETSFHPSVRQPDSCCALGSKITRWHLFGRSMTARCSLTPDKRSGE